MSLQDMNKRPQPKERCRFEGKGMEERFGNIKVGENAGTVSITEGADYFTRVGLNKLLEVKDSDIRIMTLIQWSEAVDKKMHIGGSFSAIIPLVSLFWGGIIDPNVTEPTRRGQDMFVLSKGHAVPSLASVYADLGYFDRSVLRNSRSIDSILKGHPGPILPGFHVSTGPLGQGLSVAQGFALVGKMNPHFDVFCMTGDGELQEGTIWEAITYSGHKKLDNLCVIVDKNSGQQEDYKQLVFPLLDLEKRCASCGWRVFNVDGTQYGPILEALQQFKFSPRHGRPTLIVSRTRKGYGGLSNSMIQHNVKIPDDILEQEIALQRQRREARVSDFLDFFDALESSEARKAARDKLMAAAKQMNLDLSTTSTGGGEIRAISPGVRTKRAPERNKKVAYDTSLLPKLDATKEHDSTSVVTAAMKVFAKDLKVVSIDADLARKSGLEAGVGLVDVGRALNVGIAESNMLGIGEAFAAMGYNTWVSTFCPFFDWRVMRRIAISYQERLEAIATKDGWLNTGHGLDLTFYAMASNFETRENGATHMGNDDEDVFGSVAGLKIINTSCPNQLLAVMKWIMEGNKGLVYLRSLYFASCVLYDGDFQFEFGKGYVLKESSQDKAVIVSSGRGVHEALAAARYLEQQGIAVGVVDMPSNDEDTLLSLYDSGKLIVLAEQNNGFIWSAFRKILFKSRDAIDTTRVVAVNALDENGQPQFIHSGTYQQLVNRFGLSADQLSETVKKRIE